MLAVTRNIPDDSEADTLRTQQLSAARLLPAADLMDRGRREEVSVDLVVAQHLVVLVDNVVRVLELVYVLRDVLQRDRDVERLGEQQRQVRRRGERVGAV
jgi:hypothetical protein